MAELAVAIRDAALLEGDFVLRSGKRSSYYLDKYRFSTRPDLLQPLGEAIAAAVAEHEPDAVRLAAPELGAVPLAAAASLESGLPFVIVRERGEGVRHRQPHRGRRSSRASASAWSRTSSPPAAPRSRRSRRCARRACRSRPSCASSTARRGAPTPSPGRRSGSVRCSRLGGPRRRHSDPAWLSDIRSGC